MTTDDAGAPEGAAPPAGGAGGRRARGGRAARRAARTGAGGSPGAVLGDAAWDFPLWEWGSEETLARLEENAEVLLEQAGVDFRDDVDEAGEPDVRKVLRDAGCDVQGDRVRFPRGLARSLIAKAPREFVQRARNPERSVRIGGRSTVFSAPYGMPFVLDLEGKRRYAELRDFEDIVKMTYLSPALQHSGGTVCEPTDVPVNKRHLDMVYAHLRWTDKPFMGSVTAPERARDSLEMCRIAFGPEVVDSEPVLVSLINVNSPMTYDATMLGALKVYALAGQGVLVTPFVLAGAMAPCTPAGGIAQILAESMAGLALCQALRPGCPVIMGSFITSMSMLSGAPTFGTPEPALVMYHQAQLARRLGVPFRTGGAQTAAKVPDAQSAWESAFSLWACLPAGVNLMLHAAGWLEGGLVVSLEKMLLDCETISFFHSLFKGMDMSENGQAMETLLAHAPGAHHLNTAHTQANYETAFWRNDFADSNSFEQWESEGSLDARARANAAARARLAAYEAPPVDPGVDEALRGFVARRKAEFPDSWIS